MHIAITGIVVLCSVKFLSWAISLGSGTSGGTMAPLFTIGSGLGAIFGALTLMIAPQSGVDLRIAALIGMAAMFAGATRALLTSVVMAFETTLQPVGLLPLVGACSAAYAVSSLLMKNTLMTEKIVRRGIRVPSDYQADFMDLVLVRDLDLSVPVTLNSEQTIDEIKAWIASREAGSEHQGFPLLERGKIIGVITRRDIFSTGKSGDTHIKDLISHPPVCVYEDSSLREAADHMVNHDVGRLPVLAKTHGFPLVGFVTRSDLLAAHKRRLAEHYQEQRVLRFKSSWSS
jgi:CBS domain-containing protein